MSDFERLRSYDRLRQTHSTTTTENRTHDDRNFFDHISCSNVHNSGITLYVRGQGAFLQAHNLKFWGLNKIASNNSLYPRLRSVKPAFREQLPDRENWAVWVQEFVQIKNTYK